MATNDDSSLDIDAVMRVTTYKIGDRAFDTHFAFVDADELDPVRKSIFQSFDSDHSVPSSNLGLLETLPLELVFQVCLFLDVSSALRFSQVNRAARNITAAIPQYRLLRAYALECLCVLFRTGGASNTSMSALHLALTTENCACGAFSGLLFLPTATRCCFDCLRNRSGDPQFQVVGLNDLANVAGLSAETLGKGLQLFDPLPLQLRGHFLQPFVTRPDALRSLHENQVDITNPAIIRYLHDVSMSPTKYWPTMLLSHVNATTGEVQPGILCKGCLPMNEVSHHWCEPELWSPDRFYSRNGFMQHFQKCGNARGLWMASEGGTLEVADPFAFSDSADL